MLVSASINAGEEKNETVERVKMNAPHVAALLYRVEHDESVSYKGAEPLVLDESAFRLEVKDGQIRFELKNHYATEEEAREAIEDYIRSWEFAVCLRYGPESFRIKFHKAEIVDRNPTPGVLHIRGSLTGEAGKISGKWVFGFRNFPSPPSGIRINADVRTMFDRYMNYRRKQEPLPGTAYFCLTVLENMAEGKKPDGEGKRKAASRYFQIDEEVLGEIGRLSSTKGGPSGARKGGGVSHDLTNGERCFLEEAIEKMILRAAERVHDPDADLPKITFSDLSPL